MEIKATESDMLGCNRTCLTWFDCYFLLKNNETALTKQGVSEGSCTFLVSKWTGLRTGYNREVVLWLNSRDQSLIIGQEHPYRACVKMWNLEMDVLGFGGFECGSIFFSFRNLVIAVSLNTEVLMK